MQSSLNGPIAQLDRASDFESEGWAFESLWDRQLNGYLLGLKQIDVHYSGFQTLDLIPLLSLCRYNRIEPIQVLDNQYINWRRGRLRHWVIWFKCDYKTQFSFCGQVFWKFLFEWGRDNLRTFFRQTMWSYSLLIYFRFNHMKNPNHKFKDSPTYNFTLIFIGLFFAFFITCPDEWHRPLPLIVAALLSGLISFFSVKFIKK